MKCHVNVTGKDQYRYQIWYNMTKKLPVWSSKSGFSLIYGHSELNKFLFVKLIVISASFFSNVGKNQQIFLKKSLGSNKVADAQVRCTAWVWVVKAQNEGCALSQLNCKLQMLKTKAYYSQVSKKKKKKVMNNIWNYRNLLEKLVLDLIWHTVIDNTCSWWLCVYLAGRGS